MEIVKPTSGRIVHFYHNNEPQYAAAAANYADYVPAIVTRDSDSLRVNMKIFQDGEGTCPNGWSIIHESEKQEGLAYWAWPPRV